MINKDKKIELSSFDFENMKSISCSSNSNSSLQFCSSDNEMGKPGTVKAMIIKFNKDDDIKNPSSSQLHRRNTLPSCTDLSHLVLKYTAATRHNSSESFDSNNEKKLTLDSEISKNETSIRNSNMDDTVESFKIENNFSRNCLFRKSLPSSALRKYMRNEGSQNVNSTKTDKEHKKNGNVVHSNPLSCMQRKLSLPLQKKFVYKKPDIPAVLLKKQDENNRNKLYKECSNANEVVYNNLGLNKKNAHFDIIKRSSSPSLVRMSSRVFNTRCGNNCHFCKLVDLWLVFWHMEFSKKSAVEREYESNYF